MGSSVIEGAFDGQAAAVEDMGIDHGGFDVLVPEQLLDCSNIIAGLEEMCGEGVTQGMGCDMLVDLCPASGFTDGFLDHRFMNMMAACDACAFVSGQTACGKDVLPEPFPVRIWVFVLESQGKINCPKAIQQVFLVDDLYIFQVNTQGLNERVRQDGEAVVLPFPISDDDLMVVKVYILDPQAQGFHDAQPASIHNLGNEPVGTGELGEQSFDFVLREDGGDCAGTLRSKPCKRGFIQLDVEGMPIEEEDGAECLILGGSGDFLFGCQVSEELTDLLGAHLARVAFVVK